MPVCTRVLVRLRNAEAFAENEDRAVCLPVPNKLFTTTAERTLCNRSTCGGRGALLLEALAGCISRAGCIASAQSGCKWTREVVGLQLTFGDPSIRRCVVCTGEVILLAIKPHEML